MCCRTTISPLVAEAAEYVLRNGLFTPTYTPAEGHEHLPTQWTRLIPEEGTTVTASLGEGILVLSISPSISMYAHHVGKRIAAGVCFEIAARYAEKVGGHVIQKATVAGCHAPGEAQDLELSGGTFAFAGTAANGNWRSPTP